MVYKKYIKRRGKIYGPYFYKSIKKDGKVITEYMGKTSEKKFPKKFLLLGSLGLVLFLSLVIMMTSDLTFVGKVTLDIESSYEQNEFVEGILKLSLEKGEIIPASTKVIIDLDNISYDYILSDLVSEEIISGDFSVKDKSISGSGDGYGLGPEESYPNVSFVLGIYSEIIDDASVGESESELPAEDPEESENVTEEENITIEEPGEIAEETAEGIMEEVPLEEEIVDETVKEVIQEESEEETVPEEKGGSEEEPEEAVEEEAVETIPITGAVTAEFLETAGDSYSNTTEQISLELDKTIEGEVSIDNSFTYKLKKTQTAGIISSSQDVDLVIVGKDVEVTTGYKGENTKELIINITELNIPAKEGIFSVTLVYSNTGFISISREISVGPTEEINETINETIPIEVLNQTVFTIGTDKMTYLQNETIDFSGILIANGTKINDEITLEILFNQSNVLTINVAAINGSFKYSLIGDFESEGNYVVNVFYNNLSAWTSFFYLLEYTFLEGFICKEFKDDVLWSSGYTHSKEGLTKYYTWFPEHNCSGVGSNDCLLHDVTIKTRFLHANPDLLIIDSQGEGHIQISEPDKLVCNKPMQGNYLKYLASETILEEEKDYQKYCKKDKDIASRCSVEVSDKYSVNGLCYGIKVFGSQYSIVDVVEIKYDLCWENVDE